MRSVEEAVCLRAGLVDLVHVGQVVEVGVGQLGLNDVLAEAGGQHEGCVQRARATGGGAGNGLKVERPFDRRCFRQG